MSMLEVVAYIDLTGWDFATRSNPKCFHSHTSCQTWERAALQKAKWNVVTQFVFCFKTSPSVPGLFCSSRSAPLYPLKSHGRKNTAAVLPVANFQRNILFFETFVRIFLGPVAADGWNYSIVSLGLGDVTISLCNGRNVSTNRDLAILFVLQVLFLHILLFSCDLVWSCRHSCLVRWHDLGRYEGISWRWAIA